MEVELLSSSFSDFQVVVTQPYDLEFMLLSSVHLTFSYIRLIYHPHLLTDLLHTCLQNINITVESRYSEPLKWGHCVHVDNSAMYKMYLDRQLHKSPPDIRTPHYSVKWTLLGAPDMNIQYIS